MFIDEVKIQARGGSGGNGCVSFRREKYVPKGGPNGGDGGNGGSVILRASRHLRTLVDLRYQIHYYAKSGGHGMGSNKTGKSAEDMIIDVPEGTLVKDEKGNILADLVNDGQMLRIAKGGEGGRGNSKFFSATRRAPRFAEKGEPGEERWLFLELRLLADIGLVGFPNAGKSTLISVISNCKPKIADYPFTTLKPNLGIVKLGYDSFSVADIPGLIEGAHKGTGLGDKFLRHVERTRIIAHVIDSCEEDLLQRYNIINKELSLFDKGLSERFSIIILNKMDSVPIDKDFHEIEEYASKNNIPMFKISAVANKGIKELLDFLSSKLKEIDSNIEEIKENTKDDNELEYKLYTLPEDEQALKYEKRGNDYIISGGKIEKVAKRIDFNNEYALEWFHVFLKENGVISHLIKLGIKEGDGVIIDNFSFEFHEDD